MDYGKKTVGILTLGCKVNQYESEAMEEALRSLGYLVKSPEEICDAYIVNTCTVTGESDRKCRQMIRRVIRKNPNAFVAVTGCLSQMQSGEIASIDGVDYVTGNGNKMTVPRKIDAFFQNKAEKNKEKSCENRQKKSEKSCEIQVCDVTKTPYEPMRISAFPRTRAYVKIEDGCENHCTYCIIATARGSVRSRPIDDVVREVSALCENGCPEVVLTGIETASYGKDTPGVSLIDLLEAVDKIPHLQSIRLGSLEPTVITADFAERLSNLQHIAPHFHLSQQSGCSRILALMKRKYNREQSLAKMELLRRYLPTVQFTTDIIVGFPTETEEDFSETLDFVKKANYLMVHVFPYSRRAGTPASVMAGQVPEAVKKERVHRLEQTAKESRMRILSEQVGRTLPVLFETHQNGIAFGHTGEFFEVCAPSPTPLKAKKFPVFIRGFDENGLQGCLIPAKEP